VRAREIAPAGSSPACRSAQLARVLGGRYKLARNRTATGLAGRAARLLFFKENAMDAIYALDKILTLTSMLKVEATKPAEPKPKRLIPIVEVNSPDKQYADGMTQMETCLDGLRSWGEVCDAAIVTTTWNYAGSLYGEISTAQKKVGGPASRVNIIGLKLGGYMRFDDPKLWAGVSTAVEIIAENTGQSIVVLDNETALEKFNTGEQMLDYRTMRKAMDVLPREIAFWMAGPNVLMGNSAFPERFEETSDLALNMALSKAGTTFVSSYGGYPKDVDTDRRARERDTMDRITDGATIDKMYVRPTAEDRGWYVPSQVAEYAAKLPSDTIIIDTGLANWIKVGEMMAELQT